MSALTKLHHLGWVVRSIDRSLPFFQAQLGLELEVVEQMNGLTLAFIRVGESLIELLEPIAPGNRIASFLAERGEGIHHVAYEVADVAAALQEADRRGLTLINHAPVQGSRGTMIGFVDPRTPDGLLVEYVQEMLSQ